MGEYIPYKDLEKVIEDEKLKGHKIVLTGGCFDIIHRGHSYLLRKAKELGDILVVNVVNDERVKEYKGHERPIIPQLERAQMVSDIEFVDYSTIHPDTEKGPTIELARKIRPHIIVQKSGKWTLEDRRYIKELLGYDVKLKTIRRSRANTSTTKIIGKVRENHIKSPRLYLRKLFKITK